MHVWELMAQLSKYPAGAEVWGQHGAGAYTELEIVQLDGDPGVEFVAMTFAEADEE